MTTETDTTRTALDPATLAVIGNRLDAILREMTNTLLRSGRSAILTTARDFSCSLVTADNRLLASAEGLPVHIFGSHLQTQTMTDLHDDIAEGDAFLHNDPYNGNTHAADHTILVPVFVHGKHLFTAVAKAHQADIGNSFPTTYMPKARDVYQEGALIFPATRIQRNREDVTDIIRICRSRIRVPDQWYGDYLAALGAARIGEQRLIEMSEKYGIDVIEEFVEQWFDYSERRVAHALGELRSGTYTATTHHDPLPGIIEESIPVRITATVDADAGHVTLDLTDNMDCLEAGINMSRATSTNSTVTGLFNVLPSDIPHNHGTFRRIEVKIRENCIVGYPIHPTSVSVATSNLADRVINATQLALSGAASIGLAEGAASLGIGYAVIAGKDARHQDAPYVNQIVIGANGGPASALADGRMWSVPVTGGLLLRDSVEINEQKYPILIDEVRLITDSAGAGTFRGGAGFATSYRPRFGTMTGAVNADNEVNAARGVQGGHDGSSCYLGIIDLETGIETQLNGFSEFEMTPSQRVVGKDAGGGGFGSPLLRDPAAVLTDVLEGWVSRSAANDVYGVVLTDGSGAVDLTVDDAATTDLRERLAREAA